MEHRLYHIDRPKFTIAVDARPSDYIHFTVTGEDSYDVSIAYWTIVSDISRQEGVKKILVEDKLESDAELGLMEYYRIVMLLLKKFSGIRIAFCRADAGLSELLRFAEDVGLNRGLRGKIFGSLDEAKQYLEDIDS